MIIDLLHNKIVADTISEGFKKSVAEGLVPALEGIYGERMLGIQMYEDHLADDFMLDGIFYYPMTVILDGEQATHWISWPVGKDFADSIPYSYKVEEQIDFDLSPDVPLDFETAIIGRARYCEEGLIKVNVHSTSPSPTFLAGKYSQTFIDEMARQLTPQIEELMSVSGLAESGIELELVFAPATYMEHHSENVTYRRLLMTDKASAPRDFWVKWTNHRDNTPFTVSDSPVGDEIQFEIGEGVHQKLREKEYRYLIRTNNDKYQKAMGKRNITEWRDLIKRGLRRGLLTKVVKEIPLDEETILVNEKLAGVLGLSTADVVSTVVIDTPEEDKGLDVARELARVAGLELDEVSFDEEQAIDFSEDEAFVIGEEEEETETADDDDLLLTISLAREAVANRAAEAELDFDSIEVSEEVDFDEDELDGEELILDEEDEELELEDEEELEEELVLEDEEELGEEPEDELEADDESEMEIELYEDEDFEEISDEETLEEPEAAVETEPVAEPVVVEKIVRINEGPSAEEIEAKIREGLEAKIRLEYEQRARETAEAEMLKLRREQEQLLIENRRLEAQAQKELEERKRISEQRKLEEARLRAQIETQVRAEAKERERLAEAARLAVEEQRRMETERLLAERQRMEEERRAMEERARAEAEARLQAERQLEAERIRRAGKPEEVAEEPKKDNYTYIAKTVKLLFRYSVDPNITGRIHEIIKATLEYYEKDKLHIRVRASVPDKSSVILDFIEFPKEELELLQNIIKVLGNSGIGIAKAILEDPKK